MRDEASRAAAGLVAGFVSWAPSPAVRKEYLIVLALVGVGGAVALPPAVRWPTWAQALGVIGLTRRADEVEKLKRLLEMPRAEKIETMAYVAPESDRRAFSESPSEYKVSLKTFLRVLKQAST